MTLTASANLVPILANPYSGNGPNRQRVDALAAALRVVGLEARLVWDRAERAALLADADIGSWCRCVVAAGGDGSVADALNDLASTESCAHKVAPDHASPVGRAVPFATLPMGTENLFARQFGFDRSATRLAEAIARGQTVGVDLGLVEGAGRPRLFTLMASAGFDAEVVHRMDRWRRTGEHLKRVNRLSYAPRMLSAAAGYRYPRVSLEADGKTYTGSHAFVFNIPQYGGNLGIGKHADPSDGLLDWVVFERPGAVRMLGYGASVVLGRHLLRGDVRHGRSASVRLDSEAGVPMQADGDPVGSGPATVRACAGAVRVIVMS